MGTFSDLLNKFDVSLEVVNTKKATLDKAQEALNAASMEYNKAVENAQNLQSELNSAIGGVLPSSANRIRMSA